MPSVVDEKFGALPLPVELPEELRSQQREWDTVGPLYYSAEFLKRVSELPLPQPII